MPVEFREITTMRDGRYAGRDATGRTCCRSDKPTHLCDHCRAALAALTTETVAPPPRVVEVFRAQRAALSAPPKPLALSVPEPPEDESPADLRAATLAFQESRSDVPDPPPVRDYLHLRRR